MPYMKFNPDPRQAEVETAQADSNNNADITTYHQQKNDVEQTRALEAQLGNMLGQSQQQQPQQSQDLGSMQADNTQQLEQSLSQSLPAGGQNLPAGQQNGQEQGENLPAGGQNLPANGAGVNQPQQPQNYPLIYPPRVQNLMNPQEPQQPEQHNIFVRGAIDFGDGLRDAPAQIIGGAIDAINSTASATQDMADWLNENFLDLGGVSWDSDGIHFTSGRSLEGVEQPRLPTFSEGTSTTGHVIRAAAQFITGFATAGRILRGGGYALSAAERIPAIGRAIAPVNQLGAAIQGTRAGGYALNTMGRGAVADFTAFDPAQERLSNLVQAVPELQNPVTEYLEHDGDESRMEGRVRNALEGLALGPLTDGVIRGIRGIAPIVRARRAAREAMESSGREASAAEQGIELDEAAGTNMMDPDDLQLTDEDIADVINGHHSSPERGHMASDLVSRNQDGETYINWARIDTTEDVQEAMQRMADLDQPAIDAERRGTQTFEQTRMNAQTLDAWNILNERRASGQHSPLNAEQSVAVRQLWLNSGENVTRLAQQAYVNPSAQNMFALRKSMMIHSLIQRQVIGIRTETARALSSWRIPVGQTRLGDLADIVENASGDMRVNQRVAQQINALSQSGRVRELDSYVNKIAWRRNIRDVINQVWTNSLLSSPFTHVRNLISQTATIGQQLYERRAAQLMAQAFNYDSSVPNGEVGHMMSGIVDGLKDSFAFSAKQRSIAMNYFRQAWNDPEGAREMLRQSDTGTVWRTMLGGESGHGIGRVDAPMQGAFDPENWNVERNTPLGHTLNLLDSVSTLPGRSLQTSDEMFKTIAYRMELRARAAQIANEEIGRGEIPAEQFTDRMAQIIENPPEDIQGSLEDFSRYITFQDRPQNTRVWNAWRAASRFPVIGRLTLPFTRTPYNIARYSFERSPLAPLVGRWREDFAAGGGRREMAMTRMMTGSAILWMMGDLAMRGDLTGAGPDNAAARQTMRRMGVQPNSIRINLDDGSQRYFSYQGLDPISTPMLLAANITDILRNTEHDDDDPITERAIIASSMAIANQVTSQQYMMGLSNFFNMMSDPTRYGESWWQGIVRTLVPQGVAQVNRQMDPYSRYAFDLIDTAKARIPGLSRDLPPRRDLWGRPIEYKSGIGSVYDFLSPIYSSRSQSTPIDKEMNRLNLYIGMPNKTMTVNGVSIDLRQFPEAYSRYVELAGNALTEDQYGTPLDPFTNGGLMDSLNYLVSGDSPLSSEYERRSDGEDGDKAVMIRSIVSRYRQAAKVRVLQEFPEVRAVYNDRVAKNRSVNAGY